MKKIRHPFEGDIDTADQGDLLDPSFGLGDHTPPDYMGSDHTNHHNKEQKQDNAESRALACADIPWEIVNQFIKGVK